MLTQIQVRYLFNYLVFTVAGNKADDYENEFENVKQVEEWAKSIGADHIKISAKENLLVDDMFISLGNILIKTKVKKKGVELTEPTKKKSKCCLFAQK